MNEQTRRILEQVVDYDADHPEVIVAALEELKQSYDRETTPHYNRIREFMQKAGQGTPEEVVTPDGEVRVLRAKLIFEEALETISALGVRVDEIRGACLQTMDLEFFDLGDDKVDLELVIDGCCDISVVTVGTLVAFGLPDKPFLEEVDRANLRKFEPPKCPECDAPMRRSNHWNGYYWYCTRDTAHKLLPLEEGPYKRPDGKWIKPPDWTPPDILGILRDYAPQTQD